jgi:hypothetical protein
VRIGGSSASRGRSWAAPLKGAASGARGFLGGVGPAPDYFFFFGFLTSFLGLLSLAIDPPL